MLFTAGRTPVANTGQLHPLARLCLSARAPLLAPSLRAALRTYSLLVLLAPSSPPLPLPSRSLKRVRSSRRWAALELLQAAAARQVAVNQGYHSLKRGGSKTPSSLG
jgi:hypothetical protein